MRGSAAFSVRLSKIHDATGGYWKYMKKSNLILSLVNTNINLRRLSFFFLLKAGENRTLLRINNVICLVNDKDIYKSGGHLDFTHL